MNTEKIFRGASRIELTLMAAILGLIYVFRIEARRFKAFEVFGALSASIITTYGIYYMKKLT